MDEPLIKALQQQELITGEEAQCVRQLEKEPVSVYTEALILLYLGVIILCAGLGILIYKNLDQIGHTALVLGIAAACIACFAWCFKKRAGFSLQKVASPNVLFDYILLLGCLLLLIFTGYIQVTYHFFGERWGLAIFIPMVILFGMAYYFDHLGVLSLAVTNLAAWAGITVAPMEILEGNDFRDDTLIYTGVTLGLGLLLAAYTTRRRNVKAHFELLYLNFGAHLLFISLLAGQFHFRPFYLLWFLAIALASYAGYSYALAKRSYYFLVITLLYFYIAFSYVAFDVVNRISHNTAGIYLGLFYVILSGIALIRVLIHYNKKLKADASI
jgi:hypothetical protein